MNSTVATAIVRLTVVAVATISAACGGDAGTAMTPAGPTSVGVSGTGGAVIVGRVNSVGSAPPAVMATDRSSAARASTMATTNLRVTVAGTSVSSQVDGAGQFTLTGVPPGTVQLRFSGSGSDATVTLTGVEADDRIEITVTLNGNAARLNSDRRSKSNNGNSNNGNEVVGFVTSINAGARSFQAAGQTVMVPLNAVIRHGNRSLSFSDLKVGDHVQVKGSRVNGTVTATEVKVEAQGDDDDDDEDEDDDRSGNVQELSGTVTGLSGSCPSITFTVRNTIVRTDGATVFRDACTRILNATRVEVRGTMNGNGQLRATRVELDD
jgi:hypothetical protein